jgi:ketosteroid isomerase-like protein
MSDHPHAATHRRVHEAFLKGDASLVNQVLADDVVYHFLGRSSLASDHEGRNGQVVEDWPLFDDQEAFDIFFS